MQKKNMNIANARALCHDAVRYKMYFIELPCGRNGETQDKKHL